jgi:hypothetical protein
VDGQGEGGTYCSEHDMKEVNIQKVSGNTIYLQKLVNGSRTNDGCSTLCLVIY